MSHARIEQLALASGEDRALELIGSTNSACLPPERLDLFIDLPHQPVYQRFSWYRGDQESLQH